MTLKKYFAILKLIFSGLKELKRLKKEIFVTHLYQLEFLNVVLKIGIPILRTRFEGIEKTKVVTHLYQLEFLNVVLKIGKPNLKTKFKLA